MMWAYFFDFLDRARQIPELAYAGHDELMEQVFPGLRYLWVRRRDKVRQRISWWRAEVTGEWAISAGAASRTVPPPRLDLAAVKNLVEVATVHERAWADYFAEHGITPWVVDYENMIGGLDGSLESALRFLDVHPGRQVHAARPRIERQSDGHTDRWVDEYTAAKPSGELDLVISRAQKARTESSGSSEARQRTD